VKISIENQWVAVDREKPKYLGKNVSQYNSVHKKCNIDCLKFESGPPRCEAGDYLRTLEFI